MYQIMSGLAIINGFEIIYNHCEERLSKKSLGPYRLAKRRTDEKMRQVINLGFQSAILTCSPWEAETILIFARRNTLLLFVTDEWIQIALRVTDPDGPGKGDRSLIRVLLHHQVVIKPIEKD